MIRDEIAPRLIGEDAFSFERCWELGFPVTYDQLRDRRIGLVALASVDFAIWDAIGKALGQPLWQLWGGYRDSHPGEHHRRLLRPRPRRHPRRGRPSGASWASAAASSRSARLSRARTPSGSRPRARRPATTSCITIDANQGYTRSQALDLCDRVRDLDIRWFEEPCIWRNDRATCATCARGGGIPVCAGQSEHSPDGCRDLMERGAIDVCNFDASWSRRLHELAAHGGGARTSTASSSPTTRSRRSRRTCSRASRTARTSRCFHPDRDPIWWQLIANRPELVDGRSRCRRPRPRLGARPGVHRALPRRSVSRPDDADTPD